MAESEYGKYIVTKLKENIQLPNFRPGEYLPQPTPGIRRRMNHVIWMDSDVAPGAFYSECVWFFPEKDISPEEQNKVPKGGGPEAHTHPFEEVITFFGTNFDDPHDLGGEIELWLEDEQFVMDKSFLAYIPAGMRHCPLKIRRIERPMFHFTLGPGQSYQGDWNPGKKHGNEGSLTKQFVFQDKPNLKLPRFRHEIPKEVAHRIVYLDEETVAGATFYAEALWFWPGERPKPKPGDEPGVKPHTHPFPETIAFFGTNWDDLQDLGGEIELWIEDEMHVMNNSFMAFVPAGVKHCPLSIRRIDRPIFHFTAGPGKTYK